MTVKTYDPAQVNIVFAGIPIDGYAKGTFVTVARNNPTWSLKVGGSGEGLRSKSNDKSGTITLTLMQSSVSNDLLSALALLDEQSNDGTGAFMMKDLSGSSLYTAESGWLQKPADGENAVEDSDRQWVIESDAIEMFVGGNS